MGFGWRKTQELGRKKLHWEVFWDGLHCFILPIELPAITKLNVLIPERADTLPSSAMLSSSDNTNETATYNDFDTKSHTGVHFKVWTSVSRKSLLEYP